MPRPPREDPPSAAGRALPFAATAAAALVYLALALHYRSEIGPYLVDDAFIYFRYADNFARGHGLVYNPGDPVEGYTGFLWVLALGAAARAGIALIPFAQWTGIALGLVTLGLTAGVARRLLGRSPVAWLPALFLASNRTFCVWAVEGLETKLFGAAVMALLAVWVGLGSGGLWRGRVPLLGIAAAVCVLSRPGGLVLVALLGAFAGWEVRRAPARGGLRGLAWNAAVFLALGGAHLAFRWWVYGDLLPNTFYAKVVALQAGRGGDYLGALARANGLLWTGPLTLLGAWGFLARGPFAAQRRWALAAVAAWAVYLVAIGGDYFEFRFFDAVLPLWGLITAAGVGALAGRVPTPGLRRVATAALALFWLAVNSDSVRRPVEASDRLTTPEQEARYTRTFAAAGRWLALNVEPDALLAVRPAGVIAYLSRLPVLDMLGLNDREVARRRDIELDLDRAVGHQRSLSLRYLAERGVTYVVGHPQLAEIPAPAGRGIVSAEIRPGVFLLFARLAPDAVLEDRLYPLGRHRGSLAGWQPVERPGPERREGRR